MMPRFLVALACVTATAVLGGCGGSSAASPEATPGKNIHSLPADLVPSPVLGLTVTRESVKGQLAGTSSSYADALALYAFRQGDLLEATLQVTHFNKKARVGSEKFRQRLIARIGGQQPREVRIGTDDVFLTTGTQQQVAIWFRNRYLFVLSSREDFAQPRTLLRRAIEVKP